MLIKHTTPAQTVQWKRQKKDEFNEITGLCILKEETPDHTLC